MLQINQLIEFKKDGFLFSSDRTLMDMDVIHRFISNSYWAQGMTKERLQMAMDNTMCFGLYTSDGQQIGFLNVVSDYCRFAYLMNVFILEENRGKGLALWMLNLVLNHKVFKGCKWLLGTKDMHPLYKKLGFTALSAPERMMERPAKP